MTNDSANALLTIDWDFFFPTPEPDSIEAFTFYDWGQSESRFLIENIWPIRASTFLANDKPLPQVAGYDGWWDRFDIAEDATLYIGESHLSAIAPEVREGVDAVWLFDAHHDGGYRGKDSLTRRDDDGETVERWECDNWMVWYRHNGVNRRGGTGIPPSRLHVRYPEWRAWALDAEPEPMHKMDRQVIAADNMPTGTFDRLYVCRSGAWVPPWCDEQFIELIEDAPVAEIVQVSTEPEWCQPDVPRHFDLYEVEQHAHVIREFADSQRTEVK